MKNKIMKIMLVVSMLFSPASFAQGESQWDDVRDVATTTMMWGGGITALVGGFKWLNNSSEEDNCGGGEYLGNPECSEFWGECYYGASERCYNYVDRHARKADTGLRLLAWGAGAFLVGYYFDDEPLSQNFTVTPKTNGGFALNGRKAWDGLSVELKTDNLHLQKRWQF